jgi:GAF domain-containing protein
MRCRCRPRSQAGPGPYGSRDGLDSGRHAGKAGWVTLPDDALHELVALTGVVLGQDDLPSTLGQICRIATRVLSACDGASLMSFSESGPAVSGSSDDWTVSLDEMQFEEHEGPCYDASRSGLVFRIRDTASEARWPNYMPRAVEQGVRSMVSLPMNVENKVIGALNLYSREPDGFGPEELAVAEITAGHASLATQVAASMFRHRDLAKQLEEALASRAEIEQAKGIIMATMRCSADEAFQVLVGQSQAENRKLRDVAAELAAAQKR